MYIFRQAKDAILYFDKYPELLKTKFSKVIIYALFFVILVNFIYSAYPFLSYKLSSPSYDEFIQEYVPNFTIEQNKIVFEEYKKVDTNLDITLIFDPNNNYITDEEKDSIKNQIIKFTPTHIISSDLNLNMEIYPIVSLFDISEKADLHNLKFLFILSSFISFILVYLTFISMDIVLLIIFSIIISIISKYYRVNFTKQDSFKLTVYVCTVPYLLKLIFFILSMPMPTYIFIGIILAYCHFIFKSICSVNNINITKKAKD